MDLLLVLVNNDLKCQRHLVKSGAVLWNNNNCDPKMSLIHHQSEKNGSLVCNIFILEGGRLLTVDDIEVSLAVKYNTGLDEMVGATTGTLTATNMVVGVVDRY